MALVLTATSAKCAPGNSASQSQTEQLDLTRNQRNNSMPLCFDGTAAPSTVARYSSLLAPGILEGTSALTKEDKLQGPTTIAVAGSDAMLVLKS